MSTDSFAVMRRNARRDLADLAKEHFNHDLQQEDRDRLHAASRSFGLHATVGSVLGITMGALLAFRLRSLRRRTLTAFRVMEKPTHVQFADGRTEPLPDVTSLMRPSRIGDIAAYTFFGFGGLFIGGELGVLSGSFSARRHINSDSASRQRIDKAFRQFRADVLRKEADAIENGKAWVNI